MAGYEVVPSPSYPTPNYQAFGQAIANLPNDYYQGQQRQQQLAQQQAFANGIPMKNGLPDFAAMAKRFGELGNPDAALKLLQMGQQEGQFAPPFPASGPAGQASPVDPGMLPPANAATARPTVSPSAPALASPAKQPTPSLLPLFVKASQSSGVSPSYFATSAQLESRDNPNARNGNAEGLFQFMPATAKEYGILDPNDPAVATAGEAKFAAANKSALTQMLGRPPTDAELYLAHQQGATGAAELIGNPNAKAADLVGVDAVVGNGGNPKMTAAQFVALWRGRYNRTAAGTQNFGLAGGLSSGPGVAMPPQAMSPGAPLSGGIVPQVMPQAQPSLAAPPVPQGAPAPALAAQPAASARGPVVPPVRLPVDPRTNRPFTNPEDAILFLQNWAAQPGVPPQRAAQANAWAAMIAQSAAPIKLSANEELIDPRTGRVVAGSPAGQYDVVRAGTDAQGNPIQMRFDKRTGELSVLGTSGSGASTKPILTPRQETILADYVRGGGTLQNLGFGNAANIEKLKIQGMAATRAAQNSPFDPAAQQLLNLHAVYAGKVSGARSVGTYGQRLTLAANVAATAIPKALDASNAVPRNEWVPVNKAIQAYQAAKSDPALSRFAVANQQVAELWARVMSPSSVLHSRFVDLALEKLSMAKSPQAYKATLHEIWDNIKAEEEGVTGTYDQESGTGSHMPAPDFAGDGNAPNSKGLPAGDYTYDPTTGNLVPAQ